MNIHSASVQSERNVFVSSQLPDLGSVGTTIPSTSHRYCPRGRNPDCVVAIEVAHIDGWVLMSRQGSIGPVGGRWQIDVGDFVATHTYGVKQCS